MLVLHTYSLITAMCVILPSVGVFLAGFVCATHLFTLFLGDIIGNILKIDPKNIETALIVSSFAILVAVAKELWTLIG